MHRGSRRFILIRADREVRGKMGVQLILAKGVTGAVRDLVV